jgi:membrane protease YdiL (CAAX protease family)
MTKYLKMTGFVLLYIGIWFLGVKLFSYLLDLGFQSSFKNTLEILINQWGLWVFPLFVVPLLVNLLILKIRKVKISEFCRFKTLSLQDAIIVLLVTIGGIIFTIHLINISFFLKQFPEFNTYVEDAIDGNLFSTLLMAGLLMPACEEVLFRGLIFNEMRKCLPLLPVLLIHTLIYMPFQPTATIAVYAYLNFTVYALVYIFTDSLWASIMVQSLGAAGLFSLKLLGIDLVFRSWGDAYLISVTIVSLILLLIGTFALKKAPLKEIFATKSSAANTTGNAASLG